MKKCFDLSYGEYDMFDSFYEEFTFVDNCLTVQLKNVGFLNHELNLYDNYRIVYIDFVSMIFENVLSVTKNEKIFFDSLISTQDNCRMFVVAGTNMDNTEFDEFCIICEKASVCINDGYRESYDSWIKSKDFLQNIGIL